MEVVEIQEIDRSGRATRVRYRHINECRYTAKVCCNLGGQYPARGFVGDEIEVMSLGGTKPQKALLDCEARRARGVLYYRCTRLYHDRTPFVVLKKTAEGYCEAYVAEQGLRTVPPPSEELPQQCWGGRQMVNLFDLATRLDKGAKELTRLFWHLRHAGGRPYRAGWRDEDRQINVPIDGGFDPDADGVDVFVDTEWARLVSWLVEASCPQQLVKAFDM